MQSLAVIGEMQRLLARLYDAHVEHDVRDFLVTSRHDLPAAPEAAALTDEQLILVEPEAGADDSLRIALYIDAAVIDRLAQRSPFAALKATNLADYCTALEGVSHFHYVAWCCARGRPVSLLELEMQAEVDKYVGAVLLCAAQSDGRFPAHLHQVLFERVQYAAGLDRESLARYEAANRHAAKFCRYLDERFLRKRRVRVEQWLSVLRRFYRASHCEKIRQVSYA